VSLEESGASVPVEFIQNEAIEGSQLARRGNDLVAVILPRPLRVETLKLKFFLCGFGHAGCRRRIAVRGALAVFGFPIWDPRCQILIWSFTLQQSGRLLATGKLVSKKHRNGWTGGVTLALRATHSLGRLQSGPLQPWRLQLQRAS